MYIHIYVFISIYIYIYNAGTFSQEHCGVFVGRWLQCSPAAPCSKKKFYTYSDVTHTHTPCRSRVDEMDMKMK